MTTAFFRAVEKNDVAQVRHCMDTFLFGVDYVDPDSDSLLVRDFAWQLLKQQLQYATRIALECKNFDVIECMSQCIRKFLDTSNWCPPAEHIADFLCDHDCSNMSCLEEVLELLDERDIMRVFRLFILIMYRDQAESPSCIINVCLNDKLKTRPLMRACARGQRIVVSFLLEHRAIVALEDSNGMNALHFATHSGHLGIVNMLLDRCDDIRTMINRTDSQGQSALVYAVHGGHLDVAQRLVALGAHYEFDTVHTLLQIACKCGHAHLIQFLVDLGFGTTCTAFTDGTALHYAVVKAHVACVKKMLELGAPFSTISFLEENAFKANKIDYSPAQEEIWKMILTHPSLSKDSEMFHRKISLACVKLIEKYFPHPIPYTKWMGMLHWFAGRDKIVASEYVLQLLDAYPKDEIGDRPPLSWLINHFNNSTCFSHPRRAIVMLLWHAHLRQEEDGISLDGCMNNTVTLYEQSVTTMHALFELKRGCMRGGVPSPISPISVDNDGCDSRASLVYLRYVPLDLFHVILSFLYGWTITHKMIETRWRQSTEATLKRRQDTEIDDTEIGVIEQTPNSKRFKHLN